MINSDENVFEGTLATKTQKHYHSVGVTSIDSSLVYDRSGFESIGNAYNDLVNDLHELFKKSREYEVKKDTL